mgnify:CR=1 FL=1
MDIISKVHENVVPIKVDNISEDKEEDEVLFSPLTGIEVRGKRVEGSLVIVEVGLSVNLTSLTIEQVIGKRLKLLQQMKDDIIVEMKSTSHVSSEESFKSSTPPNPNQHGELQG